MKRLNVLFMTAWFPTGRQPVNGIFVREHARAVQIYDDVMVLHCSEPDQTLTRAWSVQQETDETLTEGIPTYRARYRIPVVPKTSSLVGLWSAFHAVRQIRRQGFRPDIIHAHVYAAGWMAVLFGKWWHIPVVVTEHYSGFPRRLVAGQERLKARIAFEGADLVLPVSLALQKGIEQYGFRARYQVVPNAVDFSRFSPRPRPRSGSDPVHILYAGSLISLKGIPQLLQGLEGLKARPDWHLDLVGDGPERRAFEQLAESLGLAGRVTFHGLQTKAVVADFMQRADFFVLPSLWDNMPCVIIEAMASGLPVVATRVGGIPEMVDDETGALVPPEDADALGRALALMLQTFKRFKPDVIADKARRRFRFEVVGRAFDEIYRDTIDRRLAGSRKVRIGGA